MADSRTTMCVYCLIRKATSWGGHVKSGKKRITAGWCGRHANGPKGFVGHLRDEMLLQFDLKGKWKK
jgi:hypothetical protein